MPTAGHQPGQRPVAELVAADLASSAFTGVRPALIAGMTADLMRRQDVGIATYGTALYPHNGRDAILDAYEEALDLASYLRQAIAEGTQGHLWSLYRKALGIALDLLIERRAAAWRMESTWTAPA